MTLAEVLITVGIIGVIAAITIPPLITNVTQNVFNTSTAVFNRKLEEATNQMAIADALSGYTTNEQFADAFVKYIKISKRCTSANLTECFVPKFRTGNDKSIITTRDLRTSADLTTFNNSNPLVGFTLLNGSSIIMAYNPDCAPDESKKYDASVKKTACMSMVYDINSLSGPNKMGKDILTINANITACDTQIGDLCIAAGDTTPTLLNTCTDTTWDANLTNNGYCAGNYWAGAKKSCSDQGMKLPDQTELNIIYDNRATISGLNLATGYWSATEQYPGGARLQYFYNGGGQDWNYKKFGYAVRCVR